MGNLGPGTARSSPITVTGSADADGPIAPSLDRLETPRCSDMRELDNNAIFTTVTPSGRQGSGPRRRPAPPGRRRRSPDRPRASPPWSSAPDRRQPAPGRLRAAGARYVAGGDHIPAGHEVETTRSAIPSSSSTTTSKSPGWCLYNLGKNERPRPPTSPAASSPDLEHAARPDHAPARRAEQHDRQPGQRLLRQDQGPRLRRARTPAPPPILGQLRSLGQPDEQLTTILQQYADHGRAAAAGGRGRRYPNPYPKAIDVATRSRSCACRSSTPSRPARPAGPSCRPRWTLIDQVFQKLNTTIKNAVRPFPWAPAARCVYVDAYTEARATTA